jgi:hypothetical protein
MDSQQIFYENPVFIEDEDKPFLLLFARLSSISPFFRTETLEAITCL